MAASPCSRPELVPLSGQAPRELQTPLWAQFISLILQFNPGDGTSGKSIKLMSLGFSYLYLALSDIFRILNKISSLLVKCSFYLEKSSFNGNLIMMYWIQKWQLNDMYLKREQLNQNLTNN